MLHEKKEKKKTRRRTDESKKGNRRRERDQKHLRRLKKWPKKLTQRTSTRVRGRPPMIQQVQYVHVPTPGSRHSVTCDLRPVNQEKEPAASRALPNQDGSQGYEGYECFGTFETDTRMGNGAEWAMYVVRRWIHIDCISLTAIDESGKKKNMFKLCCLAATVLAILCMHMCEIFVLNFKSIMMRVINILIRCKCSWVLGLHIDVTYN